MDVDLNDDRDFSERRGCEFDQLLLVKKEEPLFDHWKALIVVLSDRTVPTNRATTSRGKVRGQLLETRIQRPAVRLPRCSKFPLSGPSLGSSVPV